ncbi:MAG: TetR/AcrR family transcriptional regulator [Flavobacteriales bacterium]|nr:TetR/AcrR family transcriptional regulator [Flavobacteriales bacterium]
MKNTKEKIIAKALELFNNDGVKETTLRKIARELGISQGNLTYHYKTKDEIIEKLYFDLAEKMNTEMQKMTVQSSSMQVLYTSSSITMKGLYAYRFLLRDLYKILKESEKLKVHYAQLQQLRTQQTSQIFTALVQEEMVRPPEFEGEYERFYERLNILGDNWINAHELLTDQIADPVKHYVDLLVEMLYPYLTEKGKKAYWEVIQ